MAARTLRDLANTELTTLPGVSEKLAERLAVMELTTVLDVLEHYPRRYIDRTKRAELSTLAIGEEATVFAEVTSIGSRRGRNRRTIVEALVSDGEATLAVTFFNQPWREKQLTPGTQVALFGKVDRYQGRRQMVNPVVDVVGHLGEKTGVIVPIYPQSGKADVSTWQLARVVAAALEFAGALDDPLDQTFRDEWKLLHDRTWAYRGIHRPADTEEHRQAARRLRFDEFLRMQLGLIARKRALESDTNGIAHVIDGDLVPMFHQRLPYTLTSDQQLAIADIAADLARPAPMHRLLQGDVGSGKTVVALTALLYAVQGGYQGALMAPTEVLAEQHSLSAHKLLDGLEVENPRTLTGMRPVRTMLLTNRTTAAERKRMAEELAAGECDIVIGTHALLYGEIPFAQLGLVVIDEQHRFGVEQRAVLRGRGSDPDVLVMTATPIPRTAGMLIYGDLDKSELREMPPGRTPITTSVAAPESPEHNAAYTHLRERVQEFGEQAYVVCPLVEGSPRVEAKAAVELYEALANGALADLRIGLLHGQLAPNEKERVMDAFRAHDLDVIVTTTVIEVGVDVPNATVMIIEDANRFGLSQLHQLRGRVGRGGGASWCYLIGDATTPDAEQRMAAMVESTDGFLLAERDLEIRGAGEVFGERQSGFSDLKLGRIPRDEKYVIAARETAERLLDADPHLAAHAGFAEEVEDLLGDAVEFLFKS
ncbi:MAG: ATP-dependent DNA helicase RecG [Acidimicrobiia bacterium]